MKDIFKYIKAISIIMGVGILAYFGYKKISKMFRKEIYDY